MRYLSLFSGIGGFEKGIGDRAICVGFFEIDKFAIQTYKKHFNHKEYGDITKINAAELPDFDLLVGGIPCQPFSIAGKRGGFDDTRGTMFFEVARIIREKQPRLLLLENVKGLLSHDKGQTFLTILTTLDELGYDLQWQVLNSKDFGVPQNRERVFLIGHLRGTPRPQVFPFGESNQINSGEQEEQIARTLSASYYKQGQWEQYIKRGRPRYIDGKRELKFYDYDKTCPTITENCASGDQKNIVMPQLRRLTPLECEKLQGFPPNWTEGVSDTQRYKQCGNAVSVPVVKEIIKRLIL